MSNFNESVCGTVYAMISLLCEPTSLSTQHWQEFQMKQPPCYHSAPPVDVAATQLGVT
jgi:hypothetical protein